MDPQDFDFSTTTDWKGNVQRNLNATLIAFSTLFVGLRLYVRLFYIKAPGRDDVMTGIAYVGTSHCSEPRLGMKLIPLLPSDMPGYFLFT